MRVILNPFNEAPRNIISEEVDAEIAKLARAINGGLEVGNIKRTAKFGASNEVGAVQYAFKEPNSLLCLQAVGAYNTTPLELGTLTGTYYPGGATGTPVYASVVVPGQSFFTGATFKVGSTVLCTITPKALTHWDDKLGPDTTAIPRWKEGHTRIFATNIAIDTPITVTFTPAPPFVGDTQALKLYASLYMKHIHWAP